MSNESNKSDVLHASWDEVWGRVAREVSHRSACYRDQVGAVIVSPTNRIVATGYNGPPSGFVRDEMKNCLNWCQRSRETRSVTLSPEYLDCPSLHAEANALMVCDRRDRECGTIYVTSHVCFTCAKLIANSGLHAVVIPRQIPPVSHRDPERSYTFLEQCGLDVFKI